MLAKRLLPPKDKAAPANKAPSSFRYALLEIVIIIVGILLSVIITEFFSNRKDNKRETTYLRALANDLSSDLEYLEVDVEERGNQLAACEVLSRILQTQDFSPASIPAIAKALADLTKTVSFNPNTATFRVLESTGHVELIDNDEIVKKLIELYTSYYDLINQNNADVSLYRNNFLLPFLVNNLNFTAAARSSGMENPLLHNDPAVFTQLGNHVYYNQRSLSSTVVAYNQAIDHARETLVLVEKELE